MSGDGYPKFGGDNSGDVALTSMSVFSPFSIAQLYKSLQHSVLYNMTHGSMLLIDFHEYNDAHMLRGMT